MIRACTKCGVMFDPHDENRKRRESSCKACRRLYLEAHKLEVCATRKAYRESHKAEIQAYLNSRKEKSKELCAKYYTENKKRIKEKQAIWNAAHQDALRRSRRLWEERNKDKVIKHRIQSNHARRARIIQASVDGALDITSIVDKTKHVCYWCGIKLPTKGWHLDHVVPLARGGAHAAHNLVKSCATCNESKGAKLSTEWKGAKQPVLL